MSRSSLLSLVGLLSFVTLLAVFGWRVSANASSRLQEQVAVLEARPQYPNLDSARARLASLYYAHHGDTGGDPEELRNSDPWREGWADLNAIETEVVSAIIRDTYYDGGWWVSPEESPEQPEPEPAPEPEPRAPFSPVGIWDWTKRETNLSAGFTRDDGLYLVWVYPNGTGVARDGACRPVIDFTWEWDDRLATLEFADPNYSGAASLYFRDQQVDRPYGARTVTSTRSLHAPGREIEGLQAPAMGDLLTVVPDPYTGLMHWELLDTDTSGDC